jgi:hypothetical protein
MSDITVYSEGQPLPSRFDVEQANQLLVSQINTLQQLVQTNNEIARLQATKADVREVRALRSDVADLAGAVHNMQAGTELITTAQFAKACGLKKDREEMKNFGTELRQWGYAMRLESSKEVWHPAFQDYVLGHQPFSLRLYCVFRDIPVPTALLRAVKPEGWEYPAKYSYLADGI